MYPVDVYILNCMDGFDFLTDRFALHFDKFIILRFEENCVAGFGLIPNLRGNFDAVGIIQSARWQSKWERFFLL